MSANLIYHTNCPRSNFSSKSPTISASTVPTFYVFLNEAIEIFGFVWREKLRDWVAFPSRIDAQVFAQRVNILYKSS